MRENKALIQNLMLDLPVKIQDIKEFRIEQSLNNHASAYITGVLKEENQEAMHSLTSQTDVAIKMKKEKGEEIIFCGLPEKVTIRHGYDGYTISLLLKSSSFRMDILKKRRSFQDPENPYKELFQTILREYGGDTFDSASHGAVQKGPLIQYEETDWEFLKRAASQIGAGIFPDICSEKPRVYIGMPEGNSYSESGTEYSLEKNMGDYLRIQKKDGGVTEQGAMSGYLKTGADYQMGDKINIQGVLFIISEKIMEMKKGIFEYRYRLQAKEGLKQTLLLHLGLKGVSIEGQVLDVKEDKLKIHLSIDQTQDPDEAAWYPFYTAYAAKGRTGWYSMPQEGDCVQLYLPEADEKKAYVRAVSRQDGESNPKVMNPAVKYFETIDGKEIKMSPEEMTISAAEDVMYLKMEQESGVEISSHKDIRIKAGNKLTAGCRSMEIESNEKIVLSTNTSGIIIDDVVHIKG